MVLTGSPRVLAPPFAPVFAAARLSMYPSAGAAHTLCKTCYGRASAERVEPAAGCFDVAIIVSRARIRARRIIRAKIVAKVS